MQVGELAAAQLVHDLPGLLLPEGALVRALGAAQKVHGRLRPAQVEEQCLEADHQQLASEGGHKPGDAGQRDAFAVDGGGQHAQVVLAATQHVVHLFVVREDIGGARVPALVLVTQGAELGVEVALARLGRVRRLHAHVVAHDGALSRRETQAVARPALLHGFGRVGERDHGLAQDVVQAEVAERERVTLDLGRQPRPALAAPQSTHLEEVGEVGVEVQVEDELHLMVMEVAHAQQLVQTVGEEARAPHVHAGLRQRVPVRGARLEVGELHRRRVAALGRR